MMVVKTVLTTTTPFIQRDALVSHAGKDCIVVPILPSIVRSRRDSYDLQANESRAAGLLGRLEGTPCCSPRDLTSAPMELQPALSGNGGWN